jgi:predicted Zn finger-like uncharacterized protein
MDFRCEGCGREYRISDDKVRGKTLHVRCKKCQRCIVLTEGSVGSNAAGVVSRKRVQPAFLKCRFDERVKPAFQKLDSILAANEVDATSVYQWLEVLVKEVRELDELVAKVGNDRTRAAGR